jgi:hypothetical protein
MFNVSRDNNWLGFSVGLPEEPPGFRIGEDGSPLPVLASRLTSPPLPGPPGTGIPPDMGELLLQTGGPIGRETIMGLQDRFADNPYWPAERGQRMVSPVVPAGYGSPLSPAQLPRPGEMQTTLPGWSDSQVNIEDQGVPDLAVPSAGGLPSGIGSPQSPITVQYKTEGAPPPLTASPPRKSPEVDTSPGEVVVLPDGSTIADTGPKSPTGYVMSPKMDLHDVAAEGRRIGEVYRSMRANPATAGSAFPYLYATLALNVGQGGTYDHQRRGNMIKGYTQLPQFRPIANINVGLLGQKAGLTLDETLNIAGTYAQWRSSNADPNAPYGLDPQTLHYIKRGYEIGQTGMFDPPARH